MLTQPFYDAGFQTALTFGVLCVLTVGQASGLQRRGGSDCRVARRPHLLRRNCRRGHRGCRGQRGGFTAFRWAACDAWQQIHRSCSMHHQYKDYKRAYIGHALAALHL